MIKGIRISAIILSAILIYSCAADRIQVAKKEGIACKTEKTRYDFGKNRQVRALKPNDRKYTRSISHLAWNSTPKSHPSKNVVRKDKHPEMLFYGLNEAKSRQVKARQDGTELMFLKQMLKSSEINLTHNELKKLQDPVSENTEPGDVIIDPSQEEILFPVNKANNESGFSYTIKQEDYNNILQEKFTVVAGVLKLNAGKSEQPLKTPFHKREIFILMMAILGGLIPVAAIKANPKLASNISFWAAQNPWKTRFMSAGIQVAMATAGVFLGARLSDNGIHFSPLSRDILVGAFLTSSMFYPVKYVSNKLFKHSYLKQKTFDMALALTGLMLMVNAGNDPGMRASLTRLVNIDGREQQNVSMPNYHNQVPKQLLFYQNDKQLQDEQTVPLHKEASHGMKIFYTVLAVLGFLALASLVAAAACGLSCNGLVGLAYLTGIGGGLLVIGLAILTIRGIWNPRPKKNIKPSESSGSMTQTGTLQA